MQTRTFAVLILFCFVNVAGGGAQSPSSLDRPVWTMESIKVKRGHHAGNSGLAMKDSVEQLG